MQALQTGRSPALRGAPQRRNAGILRKTWSRVDAVRVQAAESTVPVDFSIKCKVDFGESVRLVGNQAFLGNWKPNKAMEMRWTEGNIWRAEARVPVGAEVEFKVVKMKPDGEATWEEGDNRTFKILGPDYGLNVISAWAKPQDTKIDAFKLSDGSKQQQQQQQASVSSNGVGAAAQQSQQQQQVGSSKGSSRSREASVTSSVASMDSGDSSSRGGNTALLSKSSFEEESASRGAWVGADPEFVRSRKKDERPAGVWRTDGLSGVALALVKGDEQASSWLKKLGLQKKLLVDEPPACRPRLADLAYLYVYATWINTGALPCTESGSHYRPNHHANLALAMFRSLEWVIGDATRGGGGRNPAAEKLILAARRMHTRLPSFSGEFRVSTPLTRIRDIAHRNDIPKPLKDEIKHTLQNKLHRSAGPEDLVATEVMLQRITAKPGEYSEAFVEEFKIFTRELREFFNASGLVELLQGTLPALDDAHGSAVRQLLQLKERVEAAGGGGGSSNGNGTSGGGGGAKLDDLMALLTATTQARSFYSAGLVAGLRNDVTDEVLAMRQRWRLADIRLEEYAFVVLSRIIGQLEEQGAPAKLPKATNLQWALPLAALTSGLRHMGLSLYDTRELLVLENELQRWHSTSPLTETRDSALRAKATVERTLRVATEYSDALTDVYAQPAAALGRALGLPEHMGTIFAEAEVRASMAFQVSKLASMLARALRAAAGQEPWDVLVPGEVSGVLRESASLDSDALGPASSSNGNGGDDGVVLVVRRADGDEELGPLGPRLRGVVLLQELPHLSHLGVRARQDRVPFVTCDDADVINRVLRPLLGRRVTLTATGDCAVSLREGGGAAAPSAAAAKQPAAKAAAPAAGSAAPDAAAITAVAKAYAAGKWGEVVVPLDKAATATCGSKSAKCGALVGLAAASGGLFAAPRGAVLPFGCLEAAVAAAGHDTEARFKELLGKLEDGGKTGDGAALDTACAQLQALVAGLAVPPALVQQVVKSLTGGKAADPAQQLLLAVRSSANVEDLAGMSAAGLYDSVVGVAAADDGAVGAAVAAVWASLYTRRAVMSRRSAGVPQSSARMAVLVMEMVAPDLSFVLHTARPRDGNDKVLLAEVAPGQGETLASGVRGTPWRFEVEKASGKVDTLAYANFSTALMLPAQGTAAAVPAFAAYGSGAATSLIEGSSGSHAAPRPHVPTALVDREVDYSTQRMSADKDWRVATVQKLAEVGGSIEKAMGGVPQDIEGGVVLGRDGSMALHVFQTRPQ